MQKINLKWKKDRDSCLWEWEAEGSNPPNAGHRSIILDGDEIPIWIIETVDVEYKTFQDVDEQFAFLEEKGDCTLEYWRRKH